MFAETVKLAVLKFKANYENSLRIVFNNQEFVYDNSMIIECYDTCLAISSKLDDGKVHTVYLEYNFIAGVEVVEPTEKTD